MVHLALTCSVLLLAFSAEAAEIRFATEAYPPYVFQNMDGSVDGAGAAQVRAMMANGAPELGYNIEIMPWARAIALAETQPNYCVFAAARTPERETAFQWVVPMLMDVNIIVTRSEGPVTATSLDEARGYSIGTQREDYTESLLRKAGFERLDLSTSFDLTLAKLLGSRIDLMAMSQSVFQRLSAQGVAIRFVAELSRQQLGIACNLRMSSEQVAHMQAGLDRVRASGEQDRIQQSFGLAPVR